MEQNELQRKMFAQYTKSSYTCLTEALKFQIHMHEVYIVAAQRTPIGSFGGQLSQISTTELGAHAIRGAVSKAGLEVEQIDEVFMGNVLSAGLGQAPARQAALKAQLPEGTPSTTINKVCASGLKAVMIGADSIALGHNQVVVVGGMENMSQVPYYLPKARYGYHYGHSELLDGLLHDGLWEAYHEFPMGNCADRIAKEMKISREAQDNYAVQSYQRVASATSSGAFSEEIHPISIPQRKKEPILMDKDEEYTKVIFEKIPQLRPVFEKDGTVTAANASTINDGAAALVLMSKEKLQELKLRPLAQIIAHADAAQAPLYFTTSPALAIQKLLKRAHTDIQSIDYFEINEAFAAVALANMELLKIQADRTNIFGGAIALGHPLGCSGARILVTLLSVLSQKGGKRGIATLCNGGGGASALLIERTSSA